jgi:membrane protein involved in colicin uptake
MLIQANTNQATPMEIRQENGHPGVMSDNAEIEAIEKAENDRKIAEAKAKAETKAIEKAENDNKKIAEAKAKAEKQRQAKVEKQVQKALNKALSYIKESPRR